MMKKLTAVLLLTAMTAGLAACGSNKGADTNTDAPAQNEGTEETVTTKTSDAAQNADIQGTITLAAAASLEKSFTEHLIPMFEEQYPEVSIEGTYDSSGKLQSQIEAGADVDIFFSAALKQMEALQEEGYIAEDASVDLLENKIVLIVPAGKENGYTSFEDIVNADMIAIGDPESVPAGKYAKEILTNLGVYNEVEKKASLGASVTEVLSWVAEGSADAGIVYATDAQTENTNGDDKEVEVVATAEDSMMQTQVVYPVGVVSASTHKDEAKAFEDFLQTDEAKVILEKAGFTINK